MATPPHYHAPQVNVPPAIFNAKLLWDPILPATTHTPARPPAAKFHAHPPNSEPASVTPCNRIFSMELPVKAVVNVPMAIAKAQPSAKKSLPGFRNIKVSL